eukprot:gene30903-35956_t
MEMEGPAGSISIPSRPASSMLHEQRLSIRQLSADDVELESRSVPLSMANMQTPLGRWDSYPVNPNDKPCSSSGRRKAAQCQSEPTLATNQPSVAAAPKRRAGRIPPRSDFVPEHRQRYRAEVASAATTAINSMGGWHYSGGLPAIPKLHKQQTQAFMAVKIKAAGTTVADWDMLLEQSRARLLHQMQEVSALLQLDPSEMSPEPLVKAGEASSHSQLNIDHPSQVSPRPPLHMAPGQVQALVQINHGGILGSSSSIGRSPQQALNNVQSFAGPPSQSMTSDMTNGMNNGMTNRVRSAGSQSLNSQGSAAHSSSMVIDKKGLAPCIEEMGELGPWRRGPSPSGNLDGGPGGPEWSTRAQHDGPGAQNGGHGGPEWSTRAQHDEPGAQPGFIVRGQPLGVVLEASTESTATHELVAPTAGDAGGSWIDELTSGMVDLQKEMDRPVETEAALKHRSLASPSGSFVGRNSKGVESDHHDHHDLTSLSPELSFSEQHSDQISFHEEEQPTGRPPRLPSHGAARAPAQQEGSCSLGRPPSRLSRSTSAKEVKPSSRQGAGEEFPSRPAAQAKPEADDSEIASVKSFGAPEQADESTSASHLHSLPGKVGAEDGLEPGTSSPHHNSNFSFDSRGSADRTETGPSPDRDQTETGSQAVTEVADITHSETSAAPGASKAQHGPDDGVLLPPFQNSTSRPATADGQQPVKSSGIGYTVVKSVNQWAPDESAATTARAREMEQISAQLQDDEAQQRASKALNKVAPKQEDYSAPVPSAMKLAPPSRRFAAPAPGGANAEAPQPVPISGSSAAAKGSKGEASGGGKAVSEEKKKAGKKLLPPTFRHGEATTQWGKADVQDLWLE